MILQDCTTRMSPALQALTHLGAAGLSRVLPEYNRQCWLGSEERAVSVLGEAISRENAASYHQAAGELAGHLSPVGGGRRTLALINLVGPGRFHRVGTLVQGGWRGHLYIPGTPATSLPHGLTLQVLPSVPLPPVFRVVTDARVEDLSYFDLGSLQTYTDIDLSPELFRALLRTFSVPPERTMAVDTRRGSSPEGHSLACVPEAGLPLSFMGLLFGWDVVLAEESLRDAPPPALMPLIEALGGLLDGARRTTLWNQLSPDLRSLLDRWHSAYRMHHERKVAEAPPATDGEVMRAIEALIDDPKTEEGRRTRQWVLRYAPMQLQLMPHSETYFTRFPERLAAMALSDGFLETLDMEGGDRGRNFFIGYVDYRMTAEGRPSVRDFKQERALEVVKSYFREFLQDQHHLLPIFQAAWRFISYEEKTGRLFDERAEQLRRLERDLFHYLARRRAHPGETLEESVRAVVNRLLEEGLYLPTAGLAGSDQVNNFRDRLLSSIRFIERLVASDDATIERYGERVSREFPNVAFYREGRTRRMEWSEVEEHRRRHLPAGDSASKPSLMIVGIGEEWGQVVRYAEAGYHLVLVDDRESVHNFFQGRREEIRALEKEHGVSILFIHSDVRSRDLVDSCAGRLDAIEYQYVTELEGTDTEAIERMLKPGGIFTEFHPVAFGREKLRGLGYQVVLERQNIPGVLGTTSDRNAYPLGTHFLMLRKPTP